MTEILIAVGVVAGLGLIAGLILAVASVVMAVPVDEKVIALREALPGANCGACGYSGCDGYAEAMAHEGAAVGLCSPGGEATVTATSEILGVAGATLAKKAAVVHCKGCADVAKQKLTYHGLPSCGAASKFYGGALACSFGCLGFGDCAKACPYGAITLTDGVAEVNPALCVGCGLCEKACPKALITLRPAETAVAVLCTNKDKGGITRKVCSAGCIGCMKCQKACPSGAITVANNLATIDPDKCTGCGDCVATCPVGCIHNV